MNVQKCGIIGCGGVGATTAYTLVESGLFNEMVLIDIDKRKAEGEALDIGHGIPSVSYTHLDVYKRQLKDSGRYFRRFGTLS